VISFRFRNRIFDAGILWCLKRSTTKKGEETRQNLKKGRRGIRIALGKTASGGKRSTLYESNLYGVDESRIKGGVLGKRKFWWGGRA